MSLMKIKHLFILIIITLLFRTMAEDTSEEVVEDSNSSAMKDTSEEVIEDSSISAGADTSVVETDSLFRSADTVLETDFLKTDSTDSIADSVALSEDDIDTSYRVWNFPYWGISIGWSVGGMPVYKHWEDGLPLTKGDVPGLSGIPNTNIDFKEVKKAVVYNVNFPVTVSFTPVIRENKRLSFYSSFFVMYKDYKAEARIDTGNITTVWKCEENFTMTDLSFGIKYSALISSTYFSISKVSEVLFSFGMSGSPLIMLRQKSVVRNDFTAFGIGVSWLAGISGLRILHEKNGLEVGIDYKGSWNGRFRDKGEYIITGRINPDISSTSDVLKFVSHRFVIYFSLLLGKDNSQIEKKTSQPEVKKVHDE